MAKRTPDPDTGIAAKAKDGQPDDEMATEIEQRRKLKEAREREEERQVQGKSGNGGTAIDDQPDAVGQDDDGQMFIYDAGRKVTLGSLIPKGKPVEHAIKFGSARRRGQGALIGFDEDVLLVIRGKVASVKPEVTRNDDESVRSVTITTNITPKVVVPADSEQGMELLAEVLEKWAKAA